MPRASPSSSRNRRQLAERRRNRGPRVGRQALAFIRWSDSVSSRTAGTHVRGGEEYQQRLRPLAAKRTKTKRQASSSAAGCLQPTVDHTMRSTLSLL